MKPNGSSNGTGYKRIAITILALLVVGAAVWAIIAFVQRSDEASSGATTPVPLSENPEPTIRKTDGSSSSNNGSTESGRPSRTPQSGKESL